MAVKPDRTMTVTKLAKHTGVTPHAVRFYARQGLLPSRARTASGYRLFGDADADRLRFIKIAQSLGFTLKEIEEIIRMSRRGHSPCPKVRETMSNRLDEQAKELKTLRRRLKHMRNALELWQDMPDAIPTGDDVCHLIEAIALTDEPPLRKLKPASSGETT